eukprot:PhF_6_TR36044/c0_g1_i1/m.52286
MHGFGPRTFALVLIAVSLLYFSKSLSHIFHSPRMLQTEREESQIFVPSASEKRCVGPYMVDIPSFENTVDKILQYRNLAPMKGCTSEPQGIQYLEKLLTPIPGPVINMGDNFSLFPFGPQLPETFEETMASGGVPWIPYNKEDVLPYSDYAQWVLSRAMTNTTNCTSQRILYQRLPSYGFGADLDIMGWSVLHAKLLNRVLVFENSWRWKRPNCGGWLCYFSSPSPCLAKDVTPSSFIAVSSKSHIKPYNDTIRVIHKMLPNTRDYGFRSDGGLLPPGVTKEDLLKLLPKNMTYERWQICQAVKYLTRYVQPWVREMILGHVRSSRLIQNSLFPQESRNAIGMHFRSGDKGKVIEFAYAFAGCGEFHVDIQATIADVIAQRNLIRDVGYFVSFDQPQTMWWLKYRLERTRSLSGSINPRIIHAGFEWPEKFDGEARKKMKALYGADFVIQVTLINLYLAIAVPTAWVNNDHSSWSRLIHTFRLMSGKARCPYVDLFQWYWDGYANVSKDEIEAQEGLRSFCIRQSRNRGKSPSCDYNASIESVYSWYGKNR